MAVLSPVAADHSSPYVSVARRLLTYTQFCYSLAVLSAFFTTAIVNGIIAAKREEDATINNDVRGPGGKPLPQTKSIQRDAEGKKTEDTFGPAARRAFFLFSVLVDLSLLAQIVITTAHYVAELPPPGSGGHGWWSEEGMIVYMLGAVFLYLYFSLTLHEWNRAPTIAHFVAWSVGLVGETIILVCSGLTKSWYLDIDYRVESALDTPHAHSRVDGYLLADLILFAIRIALLALSLTLYCTTCAAKVYYHPQKAKGDLHADAEEATPLIGNRNHRSYSTQRSQQQNGRERRNGHALAQNNGAVESYLCKDEYAAFYRPEKLPHRSLWQYFRGYFVFLPYLWPRESLRLQLTVLLCFLLVIAERWVNVELPIQFGALTDDLEGLAKGRRTEVWPNLLWLVFFKSLQGSAGILGSYRSMLWIPVSQYSYRSLTSAAFEHVHHLSLDFHLGKRTGEVLSALNKGASINVFLEQVTFQVGPMVLDLFLAVWVFYTKFDALYATLVGLIAFWYLHLTIRMAQTRADQRREMTNADREEEAVKNDSITSYETVKYFNAEEYEFRRYKNAVAKFQEAEAKVTRGMNWMNISQNSVYMLGFFAAMALGVFQVYHGQRDLAQIVMLMTYLTQLQGPLNFFNSFYRTVQNAMISGERLLELFKIQPTMVDEPGARELTACHGLIRWSNVCFRYEQRRQALKNIDFECTPGTTTAFVGESGGGKSTVFRLMFRYYNCAEGRIEIDGCDVKDLTIDSVRRFIGVVPQDTILFNDTIMYNLKYANQDATNEEVYAACRAASIHDQIMAFPDGYNTKVGDRGVRLSGGEKQRVAIARTILKNPKIIMLDEATSALDSHTEQQIQDKLGNLGQGRTVLIIAHRLSTITHADQIIYLGDGAVVEKGTHEELLAAKGRYAEMWEKQIRAQRAEERAAEARRKAHRLLRQANLSMKKQPGSPEGYNSMTSSAILPDPPDESRPHSPEDSRPQSLADYGDSSDSESASTATCHSDRH